MAVCLKIDGYIFHLSVQMDGTSRHEDWPSFTNLEEYSRHATWTCVFHDYMLFSDMSCLER